MAIGDSITAGAYLRGTRSDPDLSVSEWRGQSYAAGMDDGAVTIPNVRSSLHLSMPIMLNITCQFIRHYNSAATGGSIGSHNFLEICFGKISISRCGAVLTPPFKGSSVCLGHWDGMQRSINLMLLGPVH
jgi:hypothetical protein